MVEEPESGIKSWVGGVWESGPCRYWAGRCNPYWGSNLSFPCEPSCPAENMGYDDSWSGVPSRRYRGHP